jgi:cytidyltransferase-like protein
MTSATSSKPVVFTDGVFDMLHANHVGFLEYARSLGSKLVVGVVSDFQAQRFKRLPIIHESDRLKVVSALRCVDHAFIIHDPLDAVTMEKIIRVHSIGAVVYAGDATPEFYVPAEAAGIMHRPAYRAGINTSDIIARILSRD